MSYDKTKYFEVTDDGVTKTSELIEQFKKEMNIWITDEIDDIDNQFPIPELKTVRYFDREVESRELGKSVKEADPDNMGITFREYLILQLQYFKEEKKHLDIENWTWCSGSKFKNNKYSSIRFVYANWLPGYGRIIVYANDPGYSFPYLGCRLSRCIELKISTDLPNFETLDSRVCELESKVEKLLEIINVK